MSKQRLRFEVMDFGPVWLVGKKTVVSLGKSAAAFVEALRRDGTNAFLQDMPDRLSPRGDMIIWMGEYDGSTKTFVEIPGVLTRPGCPLREDLTCRALEKCTMGVLTVSGATRDITKGAHNKLVKQMAREGYVPDYAFGYSMEYYSMERYEKDGDEYEFSYYLPCRKEQRDPDPA